MNGDGLWGFNWTWKFWLWSIVLLIALFVGLAVLIQLYGWPGPLALMPIPPPVDAGVEFTARPVLGVERVKLGQQAHCLMSQRGSMVSLAGRHM